MMRAAALGQMGKKTDARRALDELLDLVADFAPRSRELIGRYVKIAPLIDAVIDGLNKAGLDDVRERQADTP